MNKKLFISYSKDDREVVDRLVRHLEIANRSSGTSLEFFIDTQDIEPGAEWDEVIQQNLKSAHGYVFLVSMPSLSSSYILTKELPAMAFEREVHGCPIYPFLVSDCAFDNFPVEIDASDQVLILSSLQDVGPKLVNGRRAWLNQLEPEQQESAFKEAAKKICDSMKLQNIQKPQGYGDKNSAANAVRDQSPDKLKPKPQVENYIAYIDRKQIADPLNLELDQKNMAVVATSGIESDWVEGVAIRFCHEKLVALSQQSVPHFRSEVEWPLTTSSDEMRELSLWSPLFDQFSISSSNGLETAINELRKQWIKVLNKKARIVVHYKIRVGDSDLSKDKALSLVLAQRWKTFEQSLSAAARGKVILFFSINQDEEPKTGLFSFLAKKAIDLDNLINSLKQAIGDDIEVINGGSLPKIMSGDIDSWKDSVREAGIDEAKSSTIITAAEYGVPNDGIRHRALRKKIKQDDSVSKLFKIN